MKPEYKKNYFPKLFSWNELEVLINQKTYLDSDRCIIKGCKNLSWPISKWTLNESHMPPNIFYNHLKNVAGVFFFRDMSRYKFEFNEICLQFEQEYERPFDIHIYVHYNNLNVPHPFGCHWDSQSNIIVQCEGETHWKIWPELNKNEYQDKFGAGKLKLDTEPIIDVILKSGDALFVPKHFPHEAKSETKRISLSFAGHEKSNNPDDYINREWIKL